MKSIWWTIAMLVLAGISLLANKTLAESQPHANGPTSEICVPQR